MEVLILLPPDTPTRNGDRVKTLSDLQSVENPYVGQIIYIIDTDQHILVQSLKEKQIGGHLIQNAEIDKYQELATNSMISALQKQIKEVEKYFTDLIKNAKEYDIVPIDLQEENVKEAFQLIDTEGNIHGDTIKIYKDSSLKSVDLVDQQLVFTYILSDGSENKVTIDVGKFIAETEFKDGFIVDNGKVSIKIDSNSTNELSVSEQGLKLNNIPDNKIQINEIPIGGTPLSEILTSKGITKINAGNLEEVLISLFSKEIWPDSLTRTIPTYLNVSMNNPTATLNLSGTVEVGTPVTFNSNAQSASASATLTYSGFTYGYSKNNNNTKESSSNPNSVTITGNVKSDVSELSFVISNFENIMIEPVTGTNSKPASISNKQLTVGFGYNSISVTATSPTFQATVPAQLKYYAISSLGKTSDAHVLNASSNSTIEGSSITKTNSVGITGARYMFAGTSQGVIGLDNKIELNSDNIRNFSHKSTATSFDLNIPQNTSHVYIAVLNGKTLKDVTDKNAFGTSIVESFTKNVFSNISIHGANGYSATNYTVYVYAPQALLNSNIYTITII